MRCDMSARVTPINPRHTLAHKRFASLRDHKLILLCTAHGTRHCTRGPFVICHSESLIQMQETYARGARAARDLSHRLLQFTINSHGARSPRRRRPTREDTSLYYIATGSAGERNVHATQRPATEHGTRDTDANVSTEAGATWSDAVCGFE